MERKTSSISIIDDFISNGLLKYVITCELRIRKLRNTGRQCAKRILEWKTAYHYLFRIIFEKEPFSCKKNDR